MKTSHLTFLVTICLFFSFSQLTKGCPGNDPTAIKMIENFLTHPDLSSARQETGTTSLATSQIQLVSNTAACHTLDNEFSPYKDDYKVTYFKVGNFYFVTQILKQPTNSEEIAAGLSYIYIYDRNLTFIKGYSG